PYFLGAAGLVVNTAQIKNYEKSFSLFNRADLKNRLTLLDDMREVLGAALKLKGYSVNTTNPAELAEAKKIVLGWKKNIQKFDAESFGKSYAAGEFWAVHGYQENVFRELEGNEKLKSTTVFFIPNEGGSMYMDNMAILKDSKNKELAHAFINYILEPARFAQIADYLGLPSIPNAEAAKLVKKTPRFNLADLKNCEFKEDLGTALSLYDKVWQEIRVEN
ncbi:MAG: extracellular solute-binding protein, partial [Spirochaetia bacterium]|nr:extracellular solute-binding protein [Spirochaetia bacterium]